MTLTLKQAKTVLLALVFTAVTTAVAFSAVLPAYATAEHCPDKDNANKVNGKAGSKTVNNVTASWSGEPSSVTFTNTNATNATVLWCAKGGSNFSGSDKNTGEQTTVVPAGDSVTVQLSAKEVSYFIVYSVTVERPDSPKKKFVWVCREGVVVKIKKSELQQGETFYKSYKKAKKDCAPTQEPGTVDVCNPETGEIITVPEADEDKYKPVGDEACVDDDEEDEDDGPVLGADTEVTPTSLPKTGSPIAIAAAGFTAVAGLFAGLSAAIRGLFAKFAK